MSKIQICVLCMLVYRQLTNKLNSSQPASITENFKTSRITQKEFKSQIDKMTIMNIIIIHCSLRLPPQCFLASVALLTPCVRLHLTGTNEPKVIGQIRLSGRFPT